ncbi:MAG: flagellar biosynthesis protein FlhB [Gammaproteobacteria bacterium]|jgi:flagellar biosynthetic protein FlhB
MARDDSQERTEQATPKRLKEAREKGQIARSRELNTMAITLAAAGTGLMLGPAILGRFADLMQSWLTLDRARALDSGGLYGALTGAIWQALWAVAPLFAAVAVAALAASVALGGLNFSTEALGFKWERLNPLKGLGRVFSANGLMELGKALVKFLLVGGVAVLLLWHEIPTLLGLGAAPLLPALNQMGHLVGWSFLVLSATLVIIAAADVPFQLWQHAKQLRMTRQEIRDEFKETDGQPEVKSRQRALQREMAQRRMMEEVPKADVVVTNPTHYAVALRYDGERMSAPRVVAKGADEVAARIRAVAREHDVTLYSAPPLARAIYFHTRLGEEVPAALYVAVAQLLAYIYQLKSGDAEPGVELDLPVPDDMTRSPDRREAD